MTFGLGAGRFRHPREFFEGRPAVGPMTVGDFADLRAYWEADPWGPFRDDLRNGSLWSAIFAPHQKPNATFEARPIFPYREIEYELDPEAMREYMRDVGAKEYAELQAKLAADQAEADATTTNDDEPRASAAARPDA